jgi:hypothetical protein
MAGLMDIFDKPLEEMEGEIDQALPAGKYVFRFGKPFKKTYPDKEDPTKEAMDISVSFNVVRPMENSGGQFNPAKYKSVWKRFRNSDAAQFVRFLTQAGHTKTDGLSAEQFLNTQSGRQYVADLSYSPNKQEGGDPWVNLNGLIPMDVYEQRMAKVLGTTTNAGGSDELE